MILLTLKKMLKHYLNRFRMECYCGMARKTYPLADGCDKKCTGDASASCGGDWKANVYLTGITSK